jgi:Replication-relaxation
MKITDRDFAMLKQIALFQCLSTSQICRLYFDNIKNCQRRLRKLVKAEYLSFVPVPNTRPGKPENLYYLGNNGAALLKVQSHKPRFTRELSHQRKNTDLMIDTVLNFRQSEIQCEIMPEHVIRMVKNQTIISDGAIILIKKTSALFLLENDCSTEPLRSSGHNDLEAKLAAYFNMFEDNQVALFNRFFEKSFNRFRLLLVVDCASRLRSVSKLIMKYDKYNFMLITTLAEFKKHGINGKIWTSPTQEKHQLSITG